MMNRSGMTANKKLKYSIFLLVMVISVVSLLTSCSSNGVALAPFSSTTSNAITSNANTMTTSLNTESSTQVVTTATTAATSEIATTSSATSLITNTADAGSKYLSISFGQSTINPGDTFTLNVMVTSDTPIRGLQCDLNIDPSAVQCLSVSEGTAFSNWVTAQNDPSLGTIYMKPNSFDATSAHIQAMAVSITGETAKEQSTGQYGGVTTGIAFVCQMSALPGVDKTVTLSISNVVADGVDGKTGNPVPITGFETVASQIHIGP